MAYGFQTIVASATSVILTAGLVTSDAILAGTRPYATFFDVGNDVALGLVALTWLAMGIYEKKNTFFAAGLAALALTIGGELFLRLIGGTALRWVDLAVFVVAYTAIVSAFLFAGRLYLIRFFGYAGIATLLTLVLNGIYGMASIATLGPPYVSTQGSSPLGTLIVQAFTNNWALPLTLNLLPIAASLLALAGFSKLPDARASHS